MFINKVSILFIYGFFYWFVYLFVYFICYYGILLNVFLLYYNDLEFSYVRFKIYLFKSMVIILSFRVIYMKMKVNLSIIYFYCKKENYDFGVWLYYLSIIFFKKYNKFYIVMIYFF